MDSIAARGRQRPGVVVPGTDRPGRGGGREARSNSLGRRCGGIDVRCERPMDTVAPSMGRSVSSAGRQNPPGGRPSSIPWQAHLRGQQLQSGRPQTHSAPAGIRLPLGVAATPLDN